MYLLGTDQGKWYLDLKNGTGSYGQGSAPNGADCEMTIDGNDFVKMLKGELRASSAFMSGNLKIKGDVGFAMKLEKLMTQLKSKL
jgi:putative sterol carrier protein